MYDPIQNLFDLVIGLLALGGFCVIAYYLENSLRDRKFKKLNKPSASYRFGEFIGKRKPKL